MTPRHASARNVAPATQAAPARLWRDWVRPIEMLREWRRRACDRALLRSLDSRLLRDIGLSREQLWNEAAKPFWRA
jgi:uncharacterized protein YjiS (DUF1127 family)